MYVYIYIYLSIYIFLSCITHIYSIDHSIDRLYVVGGPTDLQRLILSVYLFIN